MIVHCTGMSFYYVSAYNLIINQSVNMIGVNIRVKSI